MPKQRKRKEGVKQRKDSPFWWASFTGASGRRVQRSTGTTNKREAIKLRNKWMSEAWNQQARGIEPDHFFEQLVVLYLEGTKDVKRSNDTDRKRFKALAGFFREGRLMNKLVGADVLAYIEYRRTGGVSNKTINKELSALSSSIKWANQRLDWDLPNPVIGKRLPETNGEARCLTVDEFELLLLSAKCSRSPHTRRYLPEFCILGFTTMMRPGEILGLEWSRVDFDKRLIRLEVGDTKGKQRRMVPLNNDAFSALLRLRNVCNEHFPETPWVFTHTKPRYFGEARIQDVRKVFQTAVKRAGIGLCDAALSASYVNHRRASMHRMVDVEVISIVAGHRNLKTTMGYVHTADDRLHQAVANLPTIGTSPGKTRTCDIWINSPPFYQLNYRGSG